MRVKVHQSFIMIVDASLNRKIAPANRSPRFAQKSGFGERG
jgi:hypothetical protein